MLRVLTQEEPPTTSAQTALCISTLSPRVSLFPTPHWSSLVNSASRSPQPALLYSSPLSWLPSKLLLKPFGSNFFSLGFPNTYIQLSAIAFEVQLLSCLPSPCFHTQIRAHEHLPLISLSHLAVFDPCQQIPGLARSPIKAPALAGFLKTCMWAVLN